MRISEKEKNLKLRRSPWFWIPFAFLVVFGAYAVLSWWIPYFQFRELQSIDYSECAEGDQECFNKHWQKFHEIQAPLYRVMQSWEYIGALRHPDGTVCFMVTEPELKAPDAVLEAWLDKFGAKRFAELAPFFMRMRELFENRYHMPSPRRARIDLAGKLKWDHPFYGRQWRDYNTAELFWQWYPVSPVPRLPDQLEAEIFYHYIENGTLFQNQNLLRLIQMAHRKAMEEEVAPAEK